MSCGAVGGRHYRVAEKHSLTVKCPAGAFWDVVNTIKAAGCPRLQADGREKYLSLFRMRGARCVFFVRVFVRGGGSCSPRKNKTGRGSCGLCYNKNVQGNMTAGQGVTGTENYCFSSRYLFFWGAARAPDQRHTKTKPALSLTRRAGFRIM